MNLRLNVGNLPAIGLRGTGRWFSVARRTSVASCTTTTTTTTTTDIDDDRNDLILITRTSATIVILAAGRHPLATSSSSSLSPGAGLTAAQLDDRGRRVASTAATSLVGIWRRRWRRRRDAKVVRDDRGI